MKTKRPPRAPRAARTERPTASDDRAATVHVGLAQLACSDDPRDNLDRQLKLIERAARDGAQIICTQELFRSQYFCQVEDHRFFKLAEPVPSGPSTEALAKLARKHKVAIIGSLF